MTWSYVAEYGNAQEKFSDTVCVVYQGATALAIGDVVMVCVATDNVATTDGESTSVSTVAGTISGSFTKAMEYTNTGGGVAGDGVTVSLWYKRITSAITAGTDEIHITLSSAVMARVGYAHIFHTDQSEVNVIDVVGSANDTDPASMTINGLASREYLFVRTDATERESFGYVPSTNYTSIGTQTTSGDVSDTNVSIGTEYRIYTGTTDTTDPTTGSPQSASIYAAFVDAPLGVSLLPLSDNFDDNSMDVAKWYVGSYDGSSTTDVTVSEVNQQLEITPPSGVSGRYAGYLSAGSAMDMTGKGAFVRLLQKTNPGSGPQTEFSVHSAWNMIVGWQTTDNLIAAFKKVSGVRTGTDFTYSATDHAWLRIRESGGITYWDTAPSTADNPPLESEWVNRHSEANPITMSAVYVWLGAGTWDVSASPGTAIFDGFNTAEAESITNPVQYDLTVTPEFWGMHISAPQHEPWPLVEFKTLRLWDIWPGTYWQSINTANGVYDWTELDNHLSFITPHPVDLIYTFSGVPAWASTGGTSTEMPDETAWTDFVTAIVSRYSSTIKYWEIWNEPNETNFWTGTAAQMARLAELAAPIIRAAGCTVLSPSPQGSSSYQWFEQFFAAGATTYFDILSFHSYTYEAPETLIVDMANLRSTMLGHGVDVPIWDTEHSWGDDTWPFGASDSLKKAYLARLIVLNHALGIDRSIWYAYDSLQWGILADRSTDTLLPPGVAYNELYDWILGKDVTTYTRNGSVYSVSVSRVGGYEGEIVWNTSGDSSHVVGTGFNRVLTLAGGSSAVVAGSTTTIGIEPVLIDNSVTPIASATSSTTEEDDVNVASGTVTDPNNNGTIAVTEDDDVNSMSGNVENILGNINVTEDDDVNAATGLVDTVVTGSINRTDGDDVWSMVGSVSNHGDLAVTDGDDVSDGSVSVSITGFFDSIEDDDVNAMVGHQFGEIGVITPERVWSIVSNKIFVNPLSDAT